jgi:hypothetical protein
MTDDLTVRVKTAIDASIRSFQPGDEESFAFWDAELEKVESLFMRSELTAEKQSLLSYLRAHRVHLAFEVEKHDVVLRKSADFIRDVPASHPSFLGLAITRAHTLHLAGAHEEEIRETLDLARKPELHVGDFISLLAPIAKWHPGSIPNDTLLRKKMEEAISQLRTMDDYKSLPTVNNDLSLEESVLQVSNEVRRINRKLTEALITGSST